MMITIYGLPATIKYQDLKILISRECNISDFILDYLVSDGDGTKKVRVGLADDAEGNHLMKYLDGYRLSGHVLKLVPVGKSATANNQPQTYPPRGNFSHSDYPNQTAKTVEPKLSWSGNQWPTNPVQNTYNYQQPQALNTQYVQSQSTQPAKQFDTREISTANRAQSQTNVSQNYSYPSKTNLISLGPHRNVTSLPTNVPDASNRIQANRYPGYDGPEKPVLIMKENFRGPQSNQFISTQTVNYPNQSWSGQQVQKPYEKHSQTFDKKYNERKYPQNQTATDVTKDSFKYDRSGYQKYPDERRNSPNRQNDRLSVRNIERQSDRHVARPSDRDYDRSSDRHIRPSDRNIDRSSERHVDRSGRNIDRPEGNISISSNRNADRPYGRDIDRPADRNINKQTGISRISPTRQRQTPVSRIDDRFSPSRNRQQSPRRRLSPLTRKEEYASRRPSPPAITPVDRLASRQSPTRQAGYSPRRTDKPREFNENRVKDVRPAYEPQASKAAMYSGGYRPNVPVDVQYPRKDWKDREKQFSPKNVLEDRRDIVRMQNFDIPRASEQQRMEEEKKRSQSRNSRSPRREKSPGRHRRQSPSSRSPRRAWALEKRRSPEGREPPPPPAWPGQDGGEQEYQQRSKLTDRDVVMKVPVWECKKTDNYSKTDRRNFEEQRNRKELSKWKPVPPVNSEENTRFLDDDRYRKGGKYGRKEPERRRTLSRDDGERKSYSERHEKDLSRSERDGARYKPDFSREEYAGRIEEKKKEILHKQEQLQKEIDEVYKRAVDFTKKAEMYKKGEMNKDFHFKEERHREDREYEERPHYSFDENRRGRNLDRPNEHKSSNFGKSRDPEDFERKFGVNAAIKIKRLKATDEISEKILHQFAVNIPPDFRKRVSEELKLSVAKILLEMFGEKDVSFIEMLVKFNARHTQKDEERIFEDVMSCLPSHFKTIKRSAQDNSGIPAKVSRRSADLTLDTERRKEFGNTKLKLKQMPENKRRMAPVTKNEDGLKGTAMMNKEIKKEPSVKKVFIKGPVAVKKEVKVKAVNQITKQEFKTVTEITESKENSQVSEGDVSDEAVKGQFKLNTLMSTILEDELQDILTQIWKALPNLTTTDMEKFIAERLKNDAFVELKNVLGLNVTKRLLNVHNPLFVKIQFSCRPENGFLSKFLKSYNITRFKRIDPETNTFAAKLDAIADFDRICKAKNIKCGSAKITVSPCYKFKKCPKNLNTVYNDTTEYENYFNEDTTDKVKNKNSSSIESCETEKFDEEIGQNKPTPDKESTADEPAQVIKSKENKHIDSKNNNFMNYEDMYEEVQEMDPEMNEEMADEEILALISGGVVLDECSGSDRE
ncbi:zinc finger CCCH domain-containing protein 13-like isoform X3 [Danaus plexippus]|uniref:zinc finger CCCH domain-containing protein 13-like isoform X3 n=1 Tax=Danaus plexippus TaxID=13037 RepID=UPI002AB02869|nr:zinc finger CCCH domain-containing protein 13-like isoform X3 [Danaus plexippus]